MADADKTVADNETVTLDSETLATTKERAKPKRQPRYNVILWNDEEHSFEYVIRMMRKLFGYPMEKGQQIAEEVHLKGRAICLTTTREHAELKRDQIHAFGPDRVVAECQGAMWATIEPVDE